MSLRQALQALDLARLEDAFDGAFDKSDNFDEAGLMVDGLAEEFPALETLLARLRDRTTEELTDEPAANYVVLGGLVVLLALVEYTHAEDMRHRFPDVPTA